MDRFGPSKTESSEEEECMCASCCSQTAVAFKMKGTMGAAKASTAATPAAAAAPVAPPPPLKRGFFNQPSKAKENTAPVEKQNAPPVVAPEPAASVKDQKKKQNKKPPDSPLTTANQNVIKIVDKPPETAECDRPVVIEPPKEEKKELKCRQCVEKEDNGTINLLVHGAYMVHCMDGCKASMHRQCMEEILGSGKKKELKTAMCPFDDTPLTMINYRKPGRDEDFELWIRCEGVERKKEQPVKGKEGKKKEEKKIGGGGGGGGGAKRRDHHEETHQHNQHEDTPPPPPPPPPVPVLSLVDTEDAVMVPIREEERERKFVKPLPVDREARPLEKKEDEVMSKYAVKEEKVKEGRKKQKKERQVFIPGMTVIGQRGRVGEEEEWVNGGEREEVVEEQPVQPVQQMQQEENGYGFAMPQELPQRNGFGAPDWQQQQAMPHLAGMPAVPPNGYPMGFGAPPPPLFGAPFVPAAHHHQQHQQNHHNQLNHNQQPVVPPPGFGGQMMMHNGHSGFGVNGGGGGPGFGGVQRLDLHPERHAPPHHPSHHYQGHHEGYEHQEWSGEERREVEEAPLIENPFDFPSLEGDGQRARKELTHFFEQHIAVLEENAALFESSQISLDTLRNMLENFIEFQETLDEDEKRTHVETLNAIFVGSIQNDITPFLMDLGCFKHGIVDGEYVVSFKPDGRERREEAARRRRIEEEEENRKKREEDRKKEEVAREVERWNEKKKREEEERKKIEEESRRMQKAKMEEEMEERRRMLDEEKRRREEERRREEDRRRKELEEEKKKQEELRREVAEKERKLKERKEKEERLAREEELRRKAEEKKRKEEEKKAEEKRKREEKEREEKEKEERRKKEEQEKEERRKKEEREKEEKRLKEEKEKEERRKKEDQEKEERRAREEKEKEEKRLREEKEWEERKKKEEEEARRRKEEIEREEQLSEKERMELEKKRLEEKKKKEEEERRRRMDELLREQEDRRVKSEEEKKKKDKKVDKREQKELERKTREAYASIREQMQAKTSSDDSSPERKDLPSNGVQQSSSSSSFSPSAPAFIPRSTSATGLSQDVRQLQQQPKAEFNPSAPVFVPSQYGQGDEGEMMHAPLMDDEGRMVDEEWLDCNAATLADQKSTIEELLLRVKQLELENKKREEESREREKEKERILGVKMEEEKRNRENMTRLANELGRSQQEAAWKDDRLREMAVKCDTDVQSYNAKMAELSMEFNNLNGRLAGEIREKSGMEGRLRENEEREKRRRLEMEEKGARDYVMQCTVIINGLIQHEDMLGAASHFISTRRKWMHRQRIFTRALKQIEAGQSVDVDEVLSFPLPVFPPELRRVLRESYCQFYEPLHKTVMNLSFRVKQHLVANGRRYQDYEIVTIIRKWMRMFKDPAAVEVTVAQAANMVCVAKGDRPLVESQSRTLETVRQELARPSPSTSAASAAGAAAFSVSSVGSSQQMNGTTAFPSAMGGSAPSSRPASAIPTLNTNGGRGGVFGRVSTPAHTQEQTPKTWKTQSTKTREVDLRTHECSVCLDPFREGEEEVEYCETPSCREPYHIKCIKNCWKSGFRTCPICRQPMPSRDAFPAL